MGLVQQMDEHFRRCALCDHQWGQQQSGCDTMLYIHEPGDHIHCSQWKLLFRTNVSEFNIHCFTNSLCCKDHSSPTYTINFLASRNSSRTIVHHYYIHNQDRYHRDSISDIQLFSQHLFARLLEKARLAALANSPFSVSLPHNFSHSYTIQTCQHHNFLKILDILVITEYGTC